MARKKSFAIIGANSFGLSIVKTLTDKRQMVTLFDYDEEKLNLHLGEFENLDQIILDSTNKVALEKNGISQYDGVIVCFGNNMEASIVTVLNLLDLNVENIIAKARDERHKRILKAIGLDEQQVMIPDVITGQMVAMKSLFDIDSEIQSADGEYISTKVTVLEPSILNQTIGDVDLSPNKDFNIMQIRQNDILTIYAKSTVVNDLILKINGVGKEE
ncbi:hypothetical protein FQR65_LT16667 [Abscondita terminalis]|nr:hypothetical protein FQR65_LT16667 [Abscondita terminalis]